MPTIRAPALLLPRVTAHGYVTSFTSITTSDNERASRAKGPFVHVVHGPKRPAHKATNHHSATVERFHRHSL